jgi:hypothetical protein
VQHEKLRPEDTAVLDSIENPHELQYKVFP